MTAYLVAVLIVVLIYLLLSLGLTIQYGLTGLINFGLVGFFAIGAYVSALLAMKGVPLVALVPRRQRRSPGSPPGRSGWSRCGCATTISRSSRSAFPRPCGWSSSTNPG